MGEGLLRRGAIVAARALAAAAALAIAVGSAVVFEAAGKTEYALQSARMAAQVDDASVRETALRHSAELIETSWAGPTEWHAGALEALSWIGAQQTPNAQNLLDKSAEAAARSVRLSPVQPAAWARLAALADVGAKTSVCELNQCLDRSWRAARMTEAVTACTRLQLAQQHGLLRAHDERIEWTARTGFLHRRDMRRCLSFLPTHERIRAFLMAEAERAERERR